MKKPEQHLEILYSPSPCHLAKGQCTVLAVTGFLPLCHIFERVLIYIYQYAGATVYYAEGLEKIGENMVKNV